MTDMILKYGLNPDENKTIRELNTQLLNAEGLIRFLEENLKKLEQLRSSQGIQDGLITFDKMLTKEGVEFLREISSSLKGILGKIEMRLDPLFEMDGHWVTEKDLPIGSFQVAPQKIKLQKWMLYSLTTFYADWVVETVDRIIDFKPITVSVIEEGGLTKEIEIHPRSFGLTSLNTVSLETFKNGFWRYSSWGWKQYRIRYNYKRYEWFERIFGFWRRIFLKTKSIHVNPDGSVTIKKTETPMDAVKRGMNTAIDRATRMIGLDRATGKSLREKDDRAVEEKDHQRFGIRRFKGRR